MVGSLSKGEMKDNVGCVSETCYMAGLGFIGT